MDPCANTSHLDSYFVSDLLSGSWAIVPIGDTRAEFYLAIEHSRQNLRRVLDVVKLEKRMLVAAEPRMVHPDQYRKVTREKYGQVFIRSEMQRRSPKDVDFGGGGLPTRREIQVYLSTIDRESARHLEIGFINENKSSFVPSSFYKFRKELIRKFVENDIEVNVAGLGWDVDQLETFKRDGIALAYAISHRAFPDLRMVSRTLPLANKKLVLHGRVEDAVRFLAKFRFALVIENEMTYVSEKLFNAVLAGCVPLYVGPSLEECGIPTGIAIEMPRSLNSFLEKFQQIRMDNFESLIQAGEVWLSSPESHHDWGLDSMSLRLAKAINLHIEGGTSQ